MKSVAMSTHVMPTYTRLPITFEKGQGVWLWDDQGKRYLDALSGIAVCGLGHAHEGIQNALAIQAGRLIHTSNLYQVGLQENLAQKLSHLSGLDRVFFCNSGAEANEAAIKIARSYGHRLDIEIPTIVVMENSFHGRTLATLTATGNPTAQKGFEPLVEGFIRVPFDDIDALNVLRKNPNIVAVLVEPVQGEGGVNIPSKDYLKRLRRICDDSKWLLMLDEVQTGIGRTGRWFAYQHAEIIPDVCTLAKALGNGVPIGACLTRGEASLQLTAGKHGSTFGGNPLACCAALTVIDTIKQENLVEQAAEMGRYIIDRLSDSLKNNNHIVNLQGLGLMIGIELDRPCGELTQKALKQQLLINVTAGNTIRLLPPLILKKPEADLLVDTLSNLLA